MAARDSRAVDGGARLGGNSDVGGRRGAVAALVGAVGAYRPLAELYGVVDAASSQHASAVGVGLLAVATVVALVGARGRRDGAATLGAGLVGTALLGVLAAVALVGRLEAVGAAALAVGGVSVLVVAALATIVAAWTVRAAGSRVEALAFGVPVVFPLVAGPWFAAFAPETVPAVGGAGAPAVLAVAAALALTVGVAHGVYRRSLRLLAVRRAGDRGLADDRESA